MSEFNGKIYAAPPPAGVTVDPNQKVEAHSLIAFSCVFFPLAVITTGIRIYSRQWLAGQLSLDDHIMTIAMICSTVLLGCVMNMLDWGLGMDLWNVLMREQLYPNFMLLNVISAIFFCLATGFAKSSILLFYLRIFPTKPMRWTVLLLIFFTMGYSIASAFVNVFSCDPIAASWVLDLVPTAVCINRPVFYFAQAGLGIATDITTVIAPLPLLRTLQLPTKRKIGVAAILTIGAFVCVVSIIRLRSLYVLLTDANLTRNTTDALMWCILELNLSILGGNIPALKPFMKRFFPMLLGTSRGTGRATGPSHGYIRSGSHTGGLSSGKHKSFAAASSVMGGASAHSSKNRTNLGRTTDDGISEEYIMHDRHQVPSGYDGSQANSITKTVEFGFESHQSTARAY